MITIDVFPNSGHHYSFVPLSKDVISKYPVIKALCDRGKEPWRQLNHTWVRGRFATKEGVQGLWIAVESNVGDIRRGTIYDPKRSAGDAQADVINQSPYAVSDATKLPDEPMRVTIKIPAPGEPKNLLEVAEFQVVWKYPAGEPIDVDLVIDFGNTRTAVLALENMAAQDGKLASICRSIRFMRRGYDYEAFSGSNKSEDTCSIVDSWFVLNEPVFANLEPPSSGFKAAIEYEVLEEKSNGGFLSRGKVEKRHFITTRVPQMFVELSPVIIGDSARDILGNLNLEDGGNYSMSSPKRFTWDNDLIGKDAMQWWTMVLNRWNPNSNSRIQLPKLAGSMLRFFPTNGRDWPIDEPPHEAADQAQRPSPNPQTPTYPRSDAMAWAGLAILELAYRQITSEEWRRGNHPFVPRRLRNILVTFPSGWSVGETAAYRSKWQKAVDVFALSHLEDNRLVTEGGDRPTLLMDLDEAVASQLPFVYSEIRRLGNEGENWIALFGRGKGADARIRIMTVDIGGGTTDISIVEYGDLLEGGGVNLEAKLLFRDSGSVAGDALVKEIIECVLLPSLGNKFKGDQERVESFENIFSSAHQSASSKAKWSRIVKLVLLPIVRQWLKDFSRGTYGCPEEGGNPWKPERIMGAEGRMVDPGALSDLNEFSLNSALAEEILGDSEPIAYRPEEIQQCIKGVFTPVIIALAKYVTAFEVDLVTLSGKPSELPQVKGLLEQLLPILPQRIIQAKDFPAGDWYPMSSDNKINDAKSVTAVGAALYKAIQNGNVPNWSVHRKGTGATVHENYWGAMPLRNQPNKFSRVYLEPSVSEATHPIMIGTCIGRKLLKSAAKPEQVYRFRWRDKEKWIGAAVNATLSVTLKRVPPQVEGDTESIEIVNIEGVIHNQSVMLFDVELQLCTLEGDEFWVDSGRFEVTWPISI